MKWKWSWAFRKKKKAVSLPIKSASGMDPEMLKQMARGVMTTRLDEIGCQECFQQVDRFVDLELAGKDAAAAMPLVQDHLNRCRDCREEYEALLTALQSVP